MSYEMPLGFFAYPSRPPRTAEVIHAAIDAINRAKQVFIKPWDECRVGGKVIITEICQAIDKAQLFCADLVGTNPNVLFELGYAIAANRRILLFLDTSVTESKKRFDQLRMLTTIGYCDYCNSEDITRAFYKEQPHMDLQSTVFAQAIEPSLASLRANESVLFLKGLHNTEENITLSRRIEKLTMPVIVADPRETAVHPLAWYGEQVYRACGVFCHFTDPDREGALLHNARQALVCGMAFGFKKRLLMLAPDDYLAPVDYRGMLASYRTSSEAKRHLDTWLQEVEELWRSQRASESAYVERVSLANQLKCLQLGEYVAENETEKLIDDYFVETAAYHDALRGANSLFVGRKGTGKTANLLKLNDELGRDRRNVVCVIKPVAYELGGIVELLSKYADKSAKGFAVEALWKFLLYTEIGVAVSRGMREKHPSALSEKETEFLKFLDDNASAFQEEFSVRLERVVKVLGAIEADRGIESFRTAVTQVLHQGIIRDLRVLLGQVLSNKHRVAILVDNLDKTWTKDNDLALLSEVLLGLLSAVNRLAADFKHNDRERQPVSVSLAVFLRSDIYDSVVKAAREPDKIRASWMKWKDPDLLWRVIEERLARSREQRTDPNELLKRFFCPRVSGVSIKEHFTEAVLPRPRDLLFLVKGAVTEAVNKKHARVEEADVLAAEEQYSQFAFETMLVETGLSEGVLFEFLGCNEILSEDDLCALLARGGIPPESVQEVIGLLCAQSFLGLQIKEGTFDFVEDSIEYRKNLVLARKMKENSGTAMFYAVNRAFQKYLAVNTKASPT